MEVPVLWHSMPGEDIAGEVESDIEAGITQTEAARRIGTFGANVLPRAGGPAL
jgi:hypothetical protein